MFVKEMALVIASGKHMTQLTEIKTSHEHYTRDELGRKQGEYKSYYSNRQLDTHCFYVDDNYHGEYREWHMNGQLAEHSMCVNDKYHGECKRWWNNGQQSRHCFLKNGSNHGEFKKWDSRGNVLTHFFYVDGTAISLTELPIPETNEERMYFKLKYDLPLLPVEQSC